MKKIFVFLADGFEEGEAVLPLDIMRRAGIDAVTVSINESRTVTSSHGLVVMADETISSVDASECDGVFLPGGMPGALNLSQSWPLNELIIKCNAEGKLISAICASPSVVLANLGILDGRDATCYPGCEKYSPKKDFLDVGVAMDGNIITGMSVGYAMDFALSVVCFLEGHEKADEVYKAIVPGGEEGEEE